MKRILFWFGVLFIGLILVVGVILWQYTDTAIRFGASAFWKATTGQALSLGEIDFSNTHFSIDRIEIQEPDGNPFLEMVGLKVQTEGWVQETHYQVDKFQIHRLDLFLRRGPNGKWNIEELGEAFESGGKTEEQKPGPVGAAVLTPWLRDRFFIGEVNLPNVTVHIQDRGPETRIPDLDFENIRMWAREIGNLNPKKPATFQVKGIFPKKLGGDKMKINGEATPFSKPDSIKINGYFDNVDPTIFASYLAEEGYKITSGVVSARFQGTSTHPHVKGHLDITLLDFSMSLHESKKEKGFLGLSDTVLNQFLKGYKEKKMDIGLDIRGTREEPKFLLDEKTKVMIAKKIGGMTLQSGLMVLNPAAGGTLLGIEKLEEKLGLGEKLKRKLFGKD